MIDLKSYTDYFMKLAELSTEVKHFLKLSTRDLGEAQTAIRNKCIVPGDIVLILENFEIAQKAANRDQLFDFATGAFAIFMNIDSRGENDMDAISEKTLRVCRDFEARMHYDQSRRQDGFIKKLITGSFEFEPTWAPVLNMFGWRVTFDFSANNPLLYLEDKWKPE